MVADLQLSKYTAERLLGSGGIGQVFLARHHGDLGVDKQVVIKRLRPELLDNSAACQMFVDEARIASRLSHKNICQAIDLVEKEGSFFLVLEYIDGQSLSEIQKQARQRDEPLPPELAVFITMEICDGLHYVHSKRDEDGKPLNIIHRDISPQNVLVSREGEVKIIDLGLSKNTLRDYKSRVGTVKGKYRYMAPEQAKGTQVDHRVDIFACGVMLLEMISGKKRGEKLAQSALFSLVRDGIVRPASQLDEQTPPLIAKAVQRATCYAPKDRYASAAEMRRELAAWLPANYGRADLVSFLGSIGCSTAGSGSGLAHASTLSLTEPPAIEGIASILEPIEPDAKQTAAASPTAPPDVVVGIHEMESRNDADQKSGADGPSTDGSAEIVKPKPKAGTESEVEISEADLEPLSSTDLAPQGYKEREIVKAAPPSTSTVALASANTAMLKMDGALTDGAPASEPRAVSSPEPTRSTSSQLRIVGVVAAVTMLPLLVVLIVSHLSDDEQPVPLDQTKAATHDTRLYASFVEAMAHRDYEAAVLLYQQFRPNSPYLQRAEPSYQIAMDGLRQRRVQRIEQLAAAGKCRELDREVAVFNSLESSTDEGWVKRVTNRCTIAARAARQAASDERRSPPRAPDAGVHTPDAKVPTRPRKRKPKQAPVQPQQPAQRGLLLKARGAYQTGNHRRAIALAEKLLAQQPDHREARRIIGVSSCYIRDRSRAVSTYAKLKSSDRQMVRQVCHRLGISLARTIKD